MRSDDTAELRSAITRCLLRQASAEGETATGVPGLTLLRASAPSLVQRGILRPSFCLVTQGDKVAQAGLNTTLRYGAGDFLASSIDMPLVGQVIGATRTRPYLAVRFELTPHEVLSVVSEARIHVDTRSPGGPATFVGRCDARLLDVVRRSVEHLDDERSARFLAPLLRRELIYRLVTGPSAFAVCQSARLARADDGVGRAVDWLQAHFREPLSIAALARHATMSPSSLHHRFKAAVMMSPLQYQKRLRLEEARRLLFSGLADATGAALDVGYESHSQFTREYHRLFGAPPLRDLKRHRSDARREALAARS